MKTAWNFLILELTSAKLIWLFFRSASLSLMDLILMLFSDASLLITFLFVRNESKNRIDYMFWMDELALLKNSISLSSIY